MMVSVHQFTVREIMRKCERPAGGAWRRDRFTRPTRPRSKSAGEMKRAEAVQTDATERSDQRAEERRMRVTSHLLSAPAGAQTVAPSIQSSSDICEHLVQVITCCPEEQKPCKPLLYQHPRAGESTQGDAPYKTGRGSR